MRELCGLYSKEVKNFFEEEGEKPFRAKQLFDWVYQKGVIHYEEMLNIPGHLRALLKEKIILGLLTLEKTEDAADGETTKFLWKKKDPYSNKSPWDYGRVRNFVKVWSHV